MKSHLYFEKSQSIYKRNETTPSAADVPNAWRGLPSKKCTRGTHFEIFYKEAPCLT